MHLISSAELTSFKNAVVPSCAPDFTIAFGNRLSPKCRANLKQGCLVLVDAGADILSALTMTNVPEAVGIVLAAKALRAPTVTSFTVETDGRLPTGDALGDAIEAVDVATGGYPAYYMINCAHPTHFAPVMREDERWVSRVQGLRANASRCSHAELDVMTELDAGDPGELAASYKALRRRFPHLLVLGGCCGTDLKHVTAIAETCVSA